MANLPLPQGGLASFSQGFHMTDNLMDQILNRKKVAQQNEQFKAQQAQLERHFQAQLGLSKAAAGRAAQAAMDAHAKALREADPTNEAKQYLALENFIKNRGNPGATSGSKPEMIPGNEPAEQMSAQHRMPTEEAGQGQGMLSQEGLAQLQSDEINRQQQAQQAEQMGQESPQEPMPQQSNQPQNIGGPNLELMKAHPMLRGFYKKHFGYDPLAAIPQTPEEKLNAQLELFKQKEKYKSEQEQKLPAAIKTLHENIIHLSPKAHKAIQHIIDIPSPLEPWGMGAIKSGQKAAHNKAVTAAAENYAKAKGWPNTRGSIDKAESILQRGNFETDFDYHKRLKELQDELEEGMQSSQQFLHPNKKLENTANTTKTKKTVDWSKYPVGG